MRPFEIVNDRAFKSLMKAGHPNLAIPSSTTLARDVHRVYEHAKARMATFLQVSHLTLHQTLNLTYQEYDGSLSFATDCWTSPNHRAFMAVTVHFVAENEPKCVILDVREVAKSHTGDNLSTEFHEILEEFGIESKVSSYIYQELTNMLT
jgi:hypothetical protein